MCKKKKENRIRLSLNNMKVIFFQHRIAKTKLHQSDMGFLTFETIASFLQLKMPWQSVTVQVILFEIH
jgi:hypothetical protein